MSTAQELMALASKTGSKSVLANAAPLEKQKLLQVGLGTPTPVYALNIAMSGQIDGGIIPGVHIIAGPSRHFKSMYGLILCATWLRANPDGIMLFYDNEYGSSIDYFKSVGIDAERVMHIPFTDIEELRSDLTQKLNAKDGLPMKAKFCVFVDSLGNAASVKEIKDAETENSAADMTRAKTMKSLFRIITSKMRVRGVPFIGVNHTYDAIGGYGTTVSGGCVVKGTPIIMSDGFYKNIEDVSPGDRVYTIDGIRDVTHTWNPDTLEVGKKECLKLSFEDGSTIECSVDHPFYIDGKMIKASDLVEGLSLDTCY